MVSTAGRYETLLLDLKSEYRPQREWSEGRGLFLIIGHFLVGVAAGGWLFGVYFANGDSLAAAYVLAGLGGLAHLFNLARPGRVLRMMTQVKTSWVSRGFWGLGFFLVGGIVYLPAVLAPDLTWPVSSSIAQAALVLSLIGAAIMIGYMGFVYTASKGIPFWNSTLHPVMYIAYAFRGGVAVLLLAMAARGQTVTAGQGLLEFWFVITAIVLVLWILEIQGAMLSRDETARRSVRDLLAGRLALSFYGGMLLLGLVVPAVLIAGLVQSGTPAILAIVGLASVAGDFFMKFSSIKAGVYSPLRLHGA